MAPIQYQISKKRKFNTNSSSSSSNSSSTGSNAMYDRYRAIYKRRGNFGSRQRGTELKYFDGSTSLTDLSSTGTILPSSGSINLVDVGVGTNQMIGSKIWIRSIEIKGRLVLDSDTDTTTAAVDNTNMYKFALVVDHQANGGAASPINIYASQSGGTGVLVGRNMEFTKRFTVLKEWFGSMNSPITFNSTLGEYSSGKVYKSIKYYKKCNILVDFNDQVGSTRSITEVTSNNVFLVGFSMLTLGVDSQFYYRIRYTD